MNRHFLSVLVVASFSFVSGGATCMRWKQPHAHFAPVVFEAPPSLSDLIAVVNHNTQRIRQLQTDSASLTVTGLPSLRTSIAVELPRRFRLTGKLIGPELDLGSNDQLFWFWAKSDPDKALYFARHDSYARAGGAPRLPVEPQWLIEAFGLVQLDQHTLHEGPFQRDEGHVEIRSQLHTPSGPLTRVLLIDDTYGWIVQQTISDEQGQLLASVNASNHRYDQTSGATLPHRISVELPAANLSLRIDVASYSINQLYTDPAQLWALPQMDGYDLVNLAEQGGPSMPTQMFNGPRQFPAPPAYQTPRSGFRPSYRGYSQVR